MTDTISRPPRSTRRMHSPFLSISPRSRFPRRSGLCYLTTFRRPFGASFGWAIVAQGLRLVRLHRLPVVCRPFRAPFDWGVSVYRGSALSGSTTSLWSVALSGLAWCGHPSGLRLVGHLLCRGLPFHFAPAIFNSPCRAPSPACGPSPRRGSLGSAVILHSGVATPHSSKR